MFRVVEYYEAGFCSELGCGTYDYYIENVETGEVRLLEDCAILDMDCFTEEDFADCEVL